MTPRTIILDANALVQVKPTTAHGGAPVVLSLSSYDIPISMTIEHDEPAGSLKVTFHYPDREPPEERAVDGGLSVFLGKNSGKVLGFLLKPAAAIPREITVRIVEGVDRQLAHATRDNQRLNYELIKKLVKGKLEPALAEG